MAKEMIKTAEAPQAIGSYSQAIKAGNTVYISGQIALDPHTMDFVSFKNLAAICHSAGGQLQDIVKLTVYLTDMNDLPIVNDIMPHYFRQPYPARAAVAVAALPKGAPIEIEGVMVLGA